jgi:hypothetical protein
MGFYIGFVLRGAHREPAERLLVIIMRIAHICFFLDCPSHEFRVRVVDAVGWSAEIQWEHGARRAAGRPLGPDSTSENSKCACHQKSVLRIA